jgi:hypothetical protein
LLRDFGRAVRAVHPDPQRMSIRPLQCVRSRAFHVILVTTSGYPGPTLGYVPGGGPRTRLTSHRLRRYRTGQPVASPRHTTSKGPSPMTR